MQAKLVIIAGSTKPQEIRLKLPAILGRGRACSIQLPQPLVSRQHCEIFADGERLRVRDLGSLNGTLVNNERITESELVDGQLLTVGSITFRVAIDETPTSERPAGSSINKRNAPSASPQTLDNGAEAKTNFVPANEFTERAIEPIRPEPTPSEPVTLDAQPQVPPAAPVAEAPPSASESNVRADDLLPPSIPGDALPPAAIPPSAIPPAAFPPTVTPPVGMPPVAAPFPTNPIPIPSVPPMAMPVALPAATPISGPLPPGVVPPAALPNVFSALPPTSAAPPPPATPPVDSSPATDAGDEDLQAFLKSLGKKK